MRAWLCWYLIGCVLAAPVLAAQRQDFWIYGQVVEERGASRIGYWKNNANQGLGEVVVDYGRPIWKEQYATQLDQLTSGRMWRMGDNYWTLLDTNLPLKVGGVEVPIGLYYLAVKRSPDGSVWELAFIDPAKSRQRLLDSYDVGTRPSQVPVLFLAPLSFQQTEELVERLTILLTLDPDTGPGEDGPQLGKVLPLDQPGNHRATGRRIGVGLPAAVTDSDLCHGSAGSTPTGHPTPVPPSPQ